MPSKVKAVIIDEVSKEYQSIFFIKDKGVVKERFEDHFLIDWIIEDAYTNILKGYFESYKKSSNQSKSSFTSFKKDASITYWNNLFNGVFKSDYKNDENDERKSKQKRVKQIIDSDNEIMEDNDNWIESNSITESKRFNDQNNENINLSNIYPYKHQMIQKEKRKFSKGNLNNGNSKLLCLI